MRERRAPCCPSRPLLPRQRWGTWLSPLLSSCTHLWRSERGAHLLVHEQQRASLRSTCSRPLWSEQLSCSTESSGLRKVIMCSQFLTRRGRAASVLAAALNAACSDDGNTPAIPSEAVEQLIWPRRSRCSSYRHELEVWVDSLSSPMLMFGFAASFFYLDALKCTKKQL